VLVRSYTPCMSNIEVPAVSSTTITYPVIQNGDGGSTSSRPEERGLAEGALTAIVQWRRRADLFNENWFVMLRPWTTLAYVSSDLGPRVHGRTKNRSLARSERRALSSIRSLFQILYLNDGKFI